LLTGLSSKNGGGEGLRPPEQKIDPPPKFWKFKKGTSRNIVFVEGGDETNLERHDPIIKKNKLPT